MSGFVTGLYVVATPAIAALAFGQRVTRFIWIAGAVYGVGLGILSLRGLSVGFGEAVTFIGAILYAVHIVLLSRWSSAREAYAMATIQMAVITVLCLLAAAPDGLTLPRTSGDWASVVYMALAAGALAMVVQTWRRVTSMPRGPHCS